MQGSELKAIRKKLDMTQAAFAEKLGITSVYVGMLERGERPIDKRIEIQADGLRTVFESELYEAEGLPTIDDFRRWQEAWKALGRGELIGLKVVDGTLMAMCRLDDTED